MSISELCCEVNWHTHHAEDLKWHFSLPLTLVTINNFLKGPYLKSVTIYF